MHSTDIFWYSSNSFSFTMSDWSFYPPVYPPVSQKLFNEKCRCFQNRYNPLILDSAFTLWKWSSLWLNHTQKITSHRGTVTGWVSLSANEPCGDERQEIRARGIEETVKIRGLEVETEQKGAGQKEKRELKQKTLESQQRGTHEAGQ